MKNKLVYDMSNEDYHSPNGSFSSSQLKTLLKDPEVFYHEYILGNKEYKDSPAFRIGNAFHTKLLEPHKFEDEYALFNGRRHGGKWQAFQAENEGKTILGNMEIVQYKQLVDNVIQNDATIPYRTGGAPEVSLFTELEGMPIKVRADYLNLKDGYIQDLKSTSGIPNTHNVKVTTAKWDYDLSAALYLDAFNTYLRSAGEPELKDFFWIYSSKDYGAARIFKASEKMLENGRTKYKKAIQTYQLHETNGWDFSDKVIDLCPLESDIIKLDTNQEMW